jgi:predicted ATP-grasp superfamily ATP-dependent carboligase
MELVERQYGVSMFGAHAAAFTDGDLPAFEPSRMRQIGSVMGKAIVFASADIVARDTRSWLSDKTVRDIPKPGEQVAKGQPICTVFAEGPGCSACVAGLRERAQSIVSRCSSQTNS